MCASLSMVPVRRTDASHDSHSVQQFIVPCIEQEPVCPWGQAPAECILCERCPSEYGTSVPKGMTSSGSSSKIFGDRRLFLYSAEIAPGYKFSFPDAEVPIEIAAAEHYCGEMTQVPVLFCQYSSFV